MSKKHFEQDDIYDATDYTEDLPTFTSASLIQPKEFYDELGVDKVSKDIKDNAKQLVKQLSSLYLKVNDEESNEERKEIRNAFSTIEEMSLGTLLKQLRYSEHMVDALMKRLDGAGFVDTAMFKMIMEVQNNTMNITMQVANYVRNLPSYFKQLDVELNTSAQLIDVDVSPNCQNLLGARQITNDIEDDDFIKQPQMGSKDLILSLEASRKRFEEVNKLAEAQASIEDANVISEDHKEDTTTIQESAVQNETVKPCVPDNDNIAFADALGEDD
jgi:hypothetical protein